MQEEYYLNKLYPFQDEILSILEREEFDFYLTGGAALSRGYLNHRFSDDLDFFVNDNPDFKKQVDLFFSYAKNSELSFEIVSSTQSFIRAVFKKSKIDLKIDFVNDIPYKFGRVIATSFFPRIDDPLNILSNKICALTRFEVKDIVDIIAISRKYEINWSEIIEHAKKKDIWVNEVEVAKIINEFPLKSLDLIKWRDKSFKITSENVTEIARQILKG